MTITQEGGIEMLRNCKQVLAAILVVMLVHLTGGGALAVPSASFNYLETALGGGSWRYDYTLTNLGTPGPDSGYSIYDIILFLDPVATASVLTVPAGWDYFVGAGFVQSFSLNPGEPPLGTDVPPGAALPGYSFVFDYRAGNVAFDATFSNPLDPQNPVVISGVTAPSTAVPEPSTYILLGIALGAVGYARRRMNRE
jgi:hypothetical protein